MAACPEQILVLAADGWPERLLRAGECTFCGDCEGVCTPKALDRQHGLASTLLAAIGPDCLTAGGIVCQSCRDVCPEAAISFVPARVPKPRLRLESCTGCGACVPVCPSGAIELIERVRFESRQVEPGQAA